MCNKIEGNLVWWMIKRGGFWLRGWVIKRENEFLFEGLKFRAKKVIQLLIFSAFDSDWHASFLFIFVV